MAGTTTPEGQATDGPSAEEVAAEVRKKFGARVTPADRVEDAARQFAAEAEEERCEEQVDREEDAAKDDPSDLHIALGIAILLLASAFLMAVGLTAAAAMPTYLSFGITLMAVGWCARQRAPMLSGLRSTARLGATP